jgi:hypothetical protein
MANNKAFSTPIVASVSPELSAAIDNGTASTPSSEASFEWGEDPTTRYIVIETTLSGTSYKAPQPNVQGVSKKLANIWPGALYWTESKKDSNGVRLFAKLNAMVMKRDSNGIPTLDEEGELTWGEGIQVTLFKQGLSKKAKADIAGLEDAKAKANDPKMIAVIDKMISDLQASAGWVAQKLDSKSFVSGLCGSGDALAPVTMYLNMAFSPKESATFIKSVAKLAAKGEPGLLRFYIPMERISMPKEQWEPIKAKVNNNLIDLKHPNTGETISGPVFSWGNRTQPISKVELLPGKYLPSSEGMDRVLSVAETERRVAQMERNWESNEELDLKLWVEALKGRFSSSGNQWAHKAGALPKRSAGTYASTCTMWEDAAESSAKLDKWSETLRALVNVKPRLTEENQKGNDNKLFSTEACEAIITCAASQSIQPWVDFVNSVGGGSTIAPVTPTTTAPIVPTVVEVVAAVVPSEPEVKAIVEEPKAESPEATLSDADYLAAIMAMREEQSLDDLEEDLTADFFGGNIQE